MTDTTNTALHSIFRGAEFEAFLDDPYGTDQIAAIRSLLRSYDGEANQTLIRSQVETAFIGFGRDAAKRIFTHEIEMILHPHRSPRASLLTS